MTTYQISVRTSTADYAGTDANVFITLYGADGNSDEMMLDNGQDNFEKGLTDVFSVNVDRVLGSLQRVRIRHDNTGGDEGWFLDWIRVHDQSTGKEFFFPCYNWLADDEGDNLIDRILYAQ